MFTVSLRRALLALTLVAASVSPALAQTSLPLIQSPTGTLLRPTSEELIEELVDPQGQLCPNQLGLDVAIRGNRAIAAMRNCEEGRVAVFDRNSSGVWQRSGTILLQPVTGSGIWTLALGESRAFIGSECGEVQAFLRSGNEWLFEQTFGGGYCTRTRLAFDQGWLVVTHPSESVGLPPEFEQLNIWQRRNGTWTPVQSLASGEDADFSRASIAIEGSTLVIGSQGTNQGRGAVYVYKLSNGVWVRRQRITYPLSAPGDLFGASVAIGSGLIVVGAPRAQQLDPPTCGSVGASGAAYAYIPSGGSWVLRHVLSHRFADCHYQFGHRVAITATHLAVQSLGNLPDTPGKIVLYGRTEAGTWSAVGRDRGYSQASLALSPTTMMVGVPFGGLESFGVPFEAFDVGGQINAFDLATVTADPLRR